MNVDVVKADEFKLVLTSVCDGGYIDHSDKDLEKVSEAIEDYFGNELGTGDRIEISGKAEFSSASSTDTEYASVDKDTSVCKSMGVTSYIISDFDIKVVLTRSDSHVTKEIGFKSDLRMLGVQNTTYDYLGKEYSDLKKGDRCKVVEGPLSVTSTGSNTYSIDGKEYSRGFTEQGGESTEDVVIFEDGQINCDVIKRIISNIPDGKGNVTVGKDYGDFKKAYDDIAVKVVAKKALSLLLIGLLVLAAVVAVVVIALLLRKRHQ